MGLGDALKGAFRRKDSNNTTSSGSIKSTKSNRTSSFPRSSPFSSSTGINAATVPPPSYDEAVNPTTGPGIAAHRAASPTPSSASRLTAAAITTRDDPYAFLSTFDTIFLIDDSGSMAGSSWNQVATALEKITPICTAHDADGIDVYFINAKNPDRSSDGGWHNIKSSKQVTKLFRDVRPGGGTPLGTRLNKILRPYMAKYEAAVRRCGDPEETDVKPINIIVITDGVPTDDPESAIITHAKKLDKLEAPPYQVGIQFFQVGKEPGAEEFLRDLDDNLGRAANDSSLRDIVDTVTWNGRNGRSQSLSADSILKVVLGAVVRRLDRRRTSGDVARPRHLAP